ncbi:helix-turn-helix domain-containing protein [Ruminococcus flavefaciens]|uniref:helix-turn-helix domain-containing protein n=1 Tax=Ruminococcus flavefaciens TaxID=1265 RepID=UPI0002F5D110|nr:helix-turn-helix domain-containing protein [Ruminococcus flavefaciens]
MTKPLICYTAAELAELTGLSISTIRKLTRKGNLPHVKVGRRIVYPVTAIHEWMFANTIGSTAPDKDGSANG